jgi:acyl-CoA synthetase (AMP-forming)/AMP-acid ligase II/acyl carrier protein
VELLSDDEAELYLAEKSTWEARLRKEPVDLRRKVKADIGKGALMNEIRGDTIYQMLRAGAEASPEAIAITSPGCEPMTYGRLFEQVDCIIKCLAEIGVARNDRIAIVMPNSAEMIAAFLGISCIGISAPINPRHTKQEIFSFLADLPATALVIQSGATSRAALAARERGIPVFEVAPAPNTICRFTVKGSALSSLARNRLPNPDDVALILPTSGTTSKPKKVLLTHRNLCASALAIRDSLRLKSSDRCLNVMPLFHIHGLVGGLLASLAAHASFVATPDFNVDQFFEWMSELLPTWYTAVPAIHQAILGRSRDQAETMIKGRLRFIRSSSAPLASKVLEELERVFKVPVIEAYGMTEASHQISSNPLPPCERKRGSVGVASITEVAIVDDEGNFLTAGKIGEIVLRGANVTSGYEPEQMNQEAFSNGWFRTGDLGYLDADGYLFLTGRLKENVNRGGENISPREIDDVLLEHPDILQAAVFAISHPTLGETVAAAVVLRDDSQVTESKIREYLSERLANFKIPTRILMVDDIPKTSTGKVRRADLALIFAEPLKSEFVAPKNDLEALVAGIYVDVLGSQQVGSGDNFFALGGDSLRATQVISRVRSLFAVNLSIATVFTKPTVAELAKEIAASVESIDEGSKTVILALLRELSKSGSPDAIVANSGKAGPTTRGTA